MRLTPARPPWTADNFNPRTPCGVRPDPAGVPHPGETISIHAPRAGCDTERQQDSREKILFQSTHPVRGATIPYMTSLTGKDISIHAPRAGCDRRPAHRRRQTGISIHAPRAGCDSCGFWRRFLHRYFNPRTPCGVRLLHPLHKMCLMNFNPRTPCGVRLSTL